MYEQRVEQNQQNSFDKFVQNNRKRETAINSNKQQYKSINSNTQQ
jgi:hypothetical protein